MADWLWTRQALSAGLAMTNDDLGGYLREHRVPSPPPATLPSEHGETIELWTPSMADMKRDDWRVA